MSTKKQIIETSGVYFITFTCHQWLPLFEQAQAYDAVYKWFDYLKDKGNQIIGYVIMPNHVHALIAFRNSFTTVNMHVGNAKRFMAYEIVKRLKVNEANELLSKLAESVTTRDRLRGKLHEVFEPSFDWKECRSSGFIKQKLDYMHMNPCKGVWDLANSPVEYEHSSARFYCTGEQGVYHVTHCGSLEDIDLTEVKI